MKLKASEALKERLRLFGLGADVAHAKHAAQASDADGALTKRALHNLPVAGICTLAAVLLVCVFALGQTVNAHADDSQSSTVPKVQPSQISLNETASYEKAEVVYSTLDTKGNLVASYVVNQFDIKAPGRVVDYGDYEIVKNLSTEAALARQDGATIFDAVDCGVFYYEGDSTTLELPWDVEIEYWLDGERYTDPAELGGKSGALEIRLTTTKNPNVNSAFYDCFLQQITFTLPGDLCTNIEADEGATIASAGKDRTIAFAVLPGHDAYCTVRADVHDFTMGGIQIAALPYESAITMPDTSNVTSGFQQLVDAVALLKGGASDLSSGASQLAYGTSQLSDGLSMLDTEQITMYADEIENLIGFIPEAMGDVEVSEESLEATAQMLNFLADFLEGLDEQTLALIKAQLAANNITIDIDTIIPVIRGVASLLGDNAAEIVNLNEKLSDPEYIAQIQEQVQALSNGLLEFKDGVVQLADGANQLAGGMQTYADGMSELYGGVSELPGMVSSEISKMTAEYSFPEFVPQSFMSSKNEQMKNVQFVIESTGIELPKVASDEGDDEEKEEGFLDRLIALFVPKANALEAYADEGAAQAKQVKILFTHDVHSYLEPTEGFVDGVVREHGGAARLATLIKENSDDATIYVDAGDFSQGTLFQAGYETDAYELRILGELGCVATTLGNHEWDHAGNGLANMLRTALASGSPLPQIVESNLDFSGELTDEQANVQSAFDEYGVLPYTIVDVDGAKVAIFGLSGNDSIKDSPTAGMKWLDYVEAAKTTVAEIKEKESPDLIVCLSHSGTKGDGETGEDIELAEAVPDINFIVSGHSHTSYPEVVKVGDTYIGSTGEYLANLGSITLEISPDGTVTCTDYALLPIDESVEADPGIESIISGFKDTIQQTYLAPYGASYDEVIAQSKFDFMPLSEMYATHQEYPMGDLIADSYIYEANE
ncbi:MAG: metallophosphoesterase, partial [Eggerthellaceae bacterium]|nr:metallophosphoesterase [Eggerthellaceae bacterium]